MSKWTRIYLWFKRLHLPAWLNEAFDRIVSITVKILSKLAEEEWNFLKSEIVRQAQKALEGDAKMENVISAFRERYSLNSIRTGELRLAIEHFLQDLKDNGTIE